MEGPVLLSQALRALSQSSPDHLKHQCGQAALVSLLRSLIQGPSDAYALHALKGSPQHSLQPAQPPSSATPLQHPTTQQAQGQGSLCIDLRRHPARTLSARGGEFEALSEHQRLVQVGL